MRFTDFAGGGQAFSPGLLKMNGSDTYLSETFTPSANAVTMVLRTKVNLFVEADQTYQYIVRQVHTGFQRGSVLAYPTDHATVPSKLVCIVRDSANTTLCYLVSTIDIVDAELHNILFAYDATAGTAVLKIDGQDVIDYGHASHVVTTGTIGTNSTDFLLGAYLPGPSNLLDGEVGFVGMSELYLTDYSAFFNSDGSPVYQDTSDWASTGFTAQPRYWNPTGDLSNNLGSEGNATWNGSIRVGDSGAFPPNRGIATIGDATSGDLPDGKVAWVDAQRIVGTQRNEGIICAADFRGSALALESYTGGATFGMLYPGVTVTSLGGGLERSPEGAKMYVPGSGFQVSNVPSYTNGRHIIATVDLDYNGYSSGLMDININRSGSDAFFCRIIWNASGYWSLNIYSTISAVVTQHAVLNLLSTIEDAYGIITVSDYGDTIVFGTVLYEKGATTVRDAAETYYYAPSRPLKASTTFAIDFEQSQAISLQSLFAINF